MRVLYFNPRRSDVPAMHAVGAEPAASLEGLLAASDVVSLHVPSTPATRGMIDAERISQMKPDGILINTARGDVVIDDDVIAALQSGRLMGAGLDVYRGEPALDQRYVGLENVVLLPHLGSATRETRDAMGTMAVENLTAVFEGREPPNRVHRSGRGRIRHEDISIARSKSGRAGSERQRGCISGRSR